MSFANIAAFHLCNSMMHRNMMEEQRRRNNRRRRKIHDLITCTLNKEKENKE